MVREGGVLKLLEFENEDLEKRFNSAMEGFLSPNLPQIVPRRNSKASCERCTAHLVGKDEDEHSIPEFDLKSSSDKMEMMGAVVERHERSQCKNANGESLEGGHGKHSHYFLIAFSNLKENSIARIGRIWKEITIEESSIPQTIDLSARVLQLASKSELTPEDKFSVISSLFASEICRLLVPHSMGVANFYFDKYIRSCTEKICSVLLLSEEMIQLFIEDRHLEIIASLLQDFLICKQVLVYKNGDLCSTVSSRFQFISGCIIFALICDKTNQLDLIRGTAYRVLLDCKSDISYALISTHIFANICGERLFGTKKERLLQNAICWVVHCIEKAGAKDLGFAPCQQCPCKMEADGTEAFVDLLLDELEACSLLKHQEPHFGCGEHCSTCTAERNALCYFTEIVSLLELVGSYMAWECAYNKLVCRLFKILELCGHEELSASILVLIGHLPRCFVEGRCDQIQVLELRDKLLNFMGTRNKSGLALQFACIGALLNLLPIKFKQIMPGRDDLSSDKGQFSREICQIRSWFSGLSEEQKGTFQSLFMANFV
ncbi:maternal effect embryo arrest 22 [Rhynchospora pubera]|uniref:Maternal effect embryo arrest 22 n=1 Tax=Rhynchospora pubera TaxID=906938 RepID=A0AAV8FFW6_9POAL|nr:maternal effect embryo arrest 22 [Rhynchospora pubera]